MPPKTFLRLLGLRADYLVEPLGAQVRRPRLSWRLESDGRGVMQRSYRIRATTTAGEALWDSGVVESDACFDIGYGGQTLESMQRVCWGVEIADSDGWQARSEPTWFETGLLDAADGAPSGWRRRMKPTLPIAPPGCNGCGAPIRSTRARTASGWISMRLPI
jgi:alpha-L-rhamnosidase